MEQIKIRIPTAKEMHEAHKKPVLIIQGEEGYSYTFKDGYIIATKVKADFDPDGKCEIKYEKTETKD